MKDLASVLSRFPEQEFAIRRFFANDSEFQEICEDYMVALKGVERWKGDDSKYTYYKKVVAELEEEIVQYIDTHRALRNSL